MHRLYSRFWINVTVLLSAVFAVLFFPPVREKYGMTVSILATSAGVLVIWAVYFVRACIFSSHETKKNRGKDRNT